MKILLTSLLITIVNYCYGQYPKAIKNYGDTYPVDSAKVYLDKNTRYKVVFDIAKSPDQKDRLNPSINTVARFINMHVAQGVPLENLDVIVVIHGSAVKDYVTDQTYAHKHSVQNPNKELIAALEKSGVRTYVCGQSFIHKGYAHDQLTTHAELALSAMTALVHFQSEGYQLINFNY